MNAFGRWATHATRTSSSAGRPSPDPANPTTPDTDTGPTPYAAHMSAGGVLQPAQIGGEGLLAGGPSGPLASGPACRLSAHRFKAIKS